jgi:monovalent cation:H+ antiporter-2, CPA2 family
MVEIALPLFVNIAEIIIIATIVFAIMKKLKQPNILAYIVAGMIIGVTGASIVDLLFGGHNFIILGYPFNIFIDTISTEVRLLSELGVAFLLFSVGIETSVKKLLKIGKPIMVGTLFQVLGVIGITIALTGLTGLLSLEESLFVGAIIAFSSTMVVMKILSDKRMTNTLDGRIMISILLIQDFLIILFVPMLANLSSIADPLLLGTILGKSILLILIAIIANRVVFPMLFKVAAEEQELFLLASISTAFVFIGISILLSIPISIGAFIGGLALSTLPYNLEIFSKIRALRDFFLTIFFVTLGIELTFNFGNLNPLLMLIIFIIIFAIKPFLMFLLTLVSGYGSKIGVRVGMSLGQVSEFGFVLATIGFYESKVIGADLFSFLITAIALSMIITPYLTTSSSRVAQFFYNQTKHLPPSMHRTFFERKIHELQKIPSKKALKDHILIIGGGTVGRGLAKALIHSGKQVLVIDHDPEVVRQGVKDGLPYIYGTSEHEALWGRVDLKDAKLLLITVLNMDEAISLIKQSKIIAPGLKIFATSHYFTETLAFYKQGVDFVSMPSIIGSNMFLQNIYTFIETGKLHHIQNFKDEYLRYLEDQVEEERRYKRSFIQ